jgi:hypothetical protein
MADNRKNITKPSNLSVENIEAEKIARYARSSYFRKKDKKAAEFLKKHPVPTKFSK